MVVQAREGEEAAAKQGHPAGLKPLAEYTDVQELRVALKQALLAVVNAQQGARAKTPTQVGPLLPDALAAASCPIAWDAQRTQTGGTERHTEAQRRRQSLHAWARG